MNNLFGWRETSSSPSRTLSKQARHKVASEPASSPQTLRSRAGILPLSRTTSDSVALGTVTTSSLARQSTGTSRKVYSQAEQYWAARALTAETLLEARTSHHNEVREILGYAESKRVRDLSALTREHNARRVQLERIVIGLLLLSLTLALSLAYLLTRSAQLHAHHTSRWISFPNHFTVPIMSPFTSVVETESAVIGARSIAILIMVVGAVIYGLFRHWMNSRTSPT